MNEIEQNNMMNEQEINEQEASDAAATAQFAAKVATARKRRPRIKNLLRSIESSRPGLSCLQVLRDEIQTNLQAYKEAAEQWLKSVEEASAAEAAMVSVLKAPAYNKFALQRVSLTPLMPKGIMTLAAGQSMNGRLLVAYYWWRWVVWHYELDAYMLPACESALAHGTYEPMSKLGAFIADRAFSEDDGQTRASITDMKLTVLENSMNPTTFQYLCYLREALPQYAEGVHVSGAVMRRLIFRCKAQDLWPTTANICRPGFRHTLAVLHNVLNEFFGGIPSLTRALQSRTLNLERAIGAPLSSMTLPSIIAVANEHGETFRELDMPYGTIKIKNRTVQLVLAQYAQRALQRAFRAIAIREEIRSLKEQENAGLDVKE